MRQASSTHPQKRPAMAEKVVVWSDQTTKFAGLIKARGGAHSGNGGFVEVSSHGLLRFNGLVDLRAPFGRFGTLLLDPQNVTISMIAGTGRR